MHLHIYSDSYYVTEKEAYENTQSAVWKLLSDYGVPNNNLIDISNYKLGEIFLQYANSIYGNEDYFFVSDHMPDSDEEFQIWSNIMWAKDPIQYSPLGDIEYKGKKYQKMTGLYVNRTHLSCEFTYDNVSVGDLKVINKVSGDADDTSNILLLKVTTMNIK